MPKSKNKKNHKERLAKYKSNKKKEQELLKKKMIENYMKMQQQAITDKESHTSTQEVSGPEINLDELNQVEIDTELNPEFNSIVESNIESTNIDQMNIKD